MPFSSSGSTAGEVLLATQDGDVGAEAVSASLRHNRGSPWAKAVFDRVLAAAILIMLIPLLLAIALAVKLDTPGPILFRQRRTGLHGQPFTILKFRSMAAACRSEHQACRGDRRVTRVGAVLRRTSADELPQLLNVLRGEMSLVGPRPHALTHDRHYGLTVSRYAQRHAVKPGMTGWAQVNGARGETAETAAMQTRVELDLWYAAHRSLALDLRILCRTCVELCRLEAY